MNLQTGKKVSSVVVALFLGLALNAEAATKRLLVQFKSASTFRTMSMQSKSSVPILLRNTNSGLKLFNTNALVTEALDNVQMLIVETDDDNAIEALRANPSVALVEEEFMHPAPPRIATLGVQKVFRASGRTHIEMPWGIQAVHAPQAWAVTKGRGARVMVLDTGLDTSHEAIASRFEAGQNFTGGSSSNITDEVGHGTHVSGTILADGLNGGLVGVAPEARLLMGKVCGTQGCPNIAIAQGIDWAIAQHVQVVNMSLGGPLMSEAEAQALRRAESAGVMIVAASGNDGQEKVSYPAKIASTFAVGAVDSHLAKADFSNWGPELDVVGPGVDVVSSVPAGTGRDSSVGLSIDNKALETVVSSPFVGAHVGPLVDAEVVYVGLGKTADFQNVNLRGKFALISRGEIPFKDKIQNAINAGAIGAVVFNNAPGLIQGQLTDDGSEVSIPAVMVEQTVGQRAVSALTSGLSVHFSMAVEATDYASFQGTSMATPHVAGVAALVRAANPSLTPAQVRDVLKSTATALGPNNFNEYGSGMVNADEAVRTAQTMGTGVALEVAN